MRSNTKKVSEKIQKHILEHYEEEGIGGFIHDMEAVKYGGMGDLTAIREMVNGGSFLVYTTDIVEFLNSLGINPTDKEYPAVDSLSLYQNLIVREGIKMVDNFRNKGGDK